MSQTAQLGLATLRTDERIMAISGGQESANSYFEPNESVLNAGVLMAIPALLSQGLNKAFSTFNALPNGFYGLQHILMLMCFMALCRIKTPEELKKQPPGEWGKLLGLDRIPEVGYLRKKIAQIVNQSKTDVLQKELFLEWSSKLPDFFFYIDGHVRVYHGSKANLPKRFVSREKLCLNGTTEFWVNTQEGLPLMVITAELNEKLKIAIIQAIESIKKELNLYTTINEPIFTLIFDREAYEPLWFKSLLTEYNVAIITYRKNVTEKWESNNFKTHEFMMSNNIVTAQLCEMGTALNGAWFREVRKLSESGHQTSIITTHPTLQTEIIAEKMFSRWTQENFFKYMSENYDFDKVLEYGVEEVSEETFISNPQYSKINYNLKKIREKKRRLQAKIFEKMNAAENSTIEQTKDIISKNKELMMKIEEYSTEIELLLENRKNTPTKITIAQMPKEIRYNKLKTESKKLKNTILMIAYRAETSLYNIMNGFYKNNKKDGRMILKEIFTTDADIKPDYTNNTLTINLHSLSNNRFNQVVKEICNLLNETQTKYPNTNLVLKFETVAF